ncbi:MAG: GNAT family N-acetyltransferase [Bacteroidota bacterium]
MEENFLVSTDRAKLDVDMIHEYLSSEAYWSKGRSRSVVEKSIANSLCFGVYHTSGQQVGFARVVTDYAVFAWLMDVFIVEDYRGRGLSKQLLTSIMNHPNLQNLQRWGLLTADAHSLYQQYGFSSINSPEWFMELVNSPS